MEQLNRDTVVYQTLHSHYIEVAGRKKDPLYCVTAAFNEDEFNIFGIEWYPCRIDFFVNGRKTFSYPRRKDAGTNQWPFDQEFYIILNQALGGSWAGKIDDRGLPAKMQGDWVGVNKQKQATDALDQPVHTPVGSMDYRAQGPPRVSWAAGAGLN